MKRDAIKTYETWLPVFTGFYGTQFEPDFESYLDELDLEWADITFDFESYRIDFGKIACEYIEKKLKSLGIIDQIIFQEMHSPKYYNYSNDSIHCEIVLTKTNIKSLKKYMTDANKIFAGYLKGRYSSCPGFISHYSYLVADWKILTFNYTDFSVNRHLLGSILDFICENEDLDPDDMKIYCDERVNCTDYCTYEKKGVLLVNQLFKIEGFTLDMVNFDAIESGIQLKEELQEILNCKDEDDISYLDFDPYLRLPQILEIIYNFILTPEESNNNYKIEFPNER